MLVYFETYFPAVFVNKLRLSTFSLNEHMWWWRRWWRWYWCW